MKKILLLGAGKIGEVITHLLASTGDYHVTVADISAQNLGRSTPKGQLQPQP